MEESLSSTIPDGRVAGIRFGLATRQEICTSSNSDCPISHVSQLSNPFLGLPVESGRCESCGTAEPGQCEGHFGYIELPIPIYHPCHVSELKQLLSLLCLKCLKMKNRKVQTKSIGVLEQVFASCCAETLQISINEVKTTDGACYLELKVPSRSRLQEGFWNFLERYGFRYGDNHRRPLLPSEVMVILRKIPVETRKRLSGKGYFPQEGYILQYLPVPPNCLSIPDISDGVSIMSSDHSIAMLKKVLRQIEIIKSSRSGTPNFEAHEVEANDLQAAVAQYLQVRGTAKASRDVETRFGLNKEPDNSSTKAWLEKMKTLFIRKGCGFSSRSVISGDPYKRVDEIGLPVQIAQRITFEERVNEHNMKFLQKLVDEKMCLTYKDGLSTYSLREGSKGHTFLRPGQVVHRRIMDGDVVFINRPPTTHKHSLQALSVYVHDDHTVKINPLICGPLSADFDGDCIHLFYPQSLNAKAEVLELFSVEKQLLSSHTGNFNLQLATDSLLSLKIMFHNYVLNRAASQQLAMFIPHSLPKPALLKACSSGPHWTALQLLQTALPVCFDCCGDRHLIVKSEILNVDYNRDAVQPIFNDIITSIFFGKGPKEVLGFFNSLQPLLMENLFSEGFSVGLEDFFISRVVIENILGEIQDISPLLYHLRSTYNELVELQLENSLRLVKMPVTNFILKSSAMGDLIDCKSDAAINKVVQQVGFLGLQLSDKGKFYSSSLVGEMAALFLKKYPFSDKYPAEEFGLVRSCLFYGLDPYQEMVHSIASREVIVRSSRGLAEPGTLFKNLMAILRDVVICYDGTVRNICSNSIIQFVYGIGPGISSPGFFVAGEPVGVLAATAMSNPAYKAVLDSSSSSNSSWEMMKEILLCSVNFKNDHSDRRVILYLNDCGCGRKYCRENAAYLVKNHLKKVSLRDAAVEFSIEYRKQQSTYESFEINAGLVGHLHLNWIQLNESNVSMHDVLVKCQDTINSFRKKKKVGYIFKAIDLSSSDCCSFRHCSQGKWFDEPCLKVSWQEASYDLERTCHVLADTVCPVLLETIIKGDRRVSNANIIWISPDTSTWIKNPCKSPKGELAIDVSLEKEAVKQSGDAWRIVLDSCLPVIHLIDTKRSIPYAIKQIHELLGVSCAFEQAVQRLSASVTMVTKGVLKEHLILLANSMTCAGNLVGFNAGGIKALSRSLNVQIPFTEATLFTPKKCFERAAEKHHVDSLSSIVASCSWGKHVAVGTGSPFELLWDTREVGLNQKDGVDVYNFLHLVRSSKGEEFSSACLGAEIDILEIEDENMDMMMSPEHNASFDKPTFEDSVEFDYGFENQKMDRNKTSQSNWEPHKVESAGGHKQLWSSSAAWKNEVKEVDEGGWSKKFNRPLLDQTDGLVSATAGNWGDRTQTDSSRSRAWDAVESGNGLDQFGSSLSPWGKKVEEVAETGWSKKESRPQPDQTDGWVSSTAGAWNGDKMHTPDMDRSGPQSDENPWGGNVDEHATRLKSSIAWGSKNGGWVSSTAGAWNGDKLHAPDMNRSGPQSDENPWGSKVDEHPAPSKSSVAWGSKNEGCVSSTAGAWNGDKLHTPDMDRSGSQSDENPWGSKVDEHHTRSKSSIAWGSKNEGWDSDKSQSQEGQDLSNNVRNCRQKVMDEQSNQSACTHGWDSPKVDTSETDAHSQWAQPKRVNVNRDADESSHGWGSSNTGEWKNKRNRPPKSSFGTKSVGGFNNDSSASGALTATRQRLDMFTSEEQDVLLDVEPIMQSIRRIMNQSMYNDGDPLSADDESYILDNVFNHHPDKTMKIGTGIDYVMVSKHTSFQESRCLYIVSTDGHKEDFSYRKCIENMIKGKYPEKAESFISKYFKRPQPRPGWRRERSQTPEGGKSESREWPQTPDGGGGLGWSMERSQTPEGGKFESREWPQTPEGGGKAESREWPQTPEDG